jgi:hypothetical protein
MKSLKSRKVYRRQEARRSGPVVVNPLQRDKQNSLLKDGVAETKEGVFSAPALSMATIASQHSPDGLRSWE